MYSLTQTGNVTVIAGLLVTVLNYFKVSIAQPELEAFIGAVIIAGGVIASWIGRYRKGDLTKLGFRK